MKKTKTAGRIAEGTLGLAFLVASGWGFNAVTHAPAPSKEELAFRENSQIDKNGNINYLLPSLAFVVGGGLLARAAKETEVRGIENNEFPSLSHG